MTTYNTGNPIGSTEVKDLYDNAQNFDTLSTTTTLETVPDRLGVPRMSLHGFEQEAKRRFESIKFQPPIPYAPGIEVTTSSLTVDYLGVLYYALPSALPFTTGAWNPAQWSPLQNTNPGNELLVFADYAIASAAAATLPDGQEIEAPNSDGSLSRFSIQSGTLVFKDYAPDAIRLQSYGSLRAYSGKHAAVDITASGLAGRFNSRGVVVGATDNGGTRIIDALGRLWERAFSGEAQASWWGVSTDNADNAPAIMAALAAMNPVPVRLPGGVINAGKITLNSFDALLGQGSEATTLRLKDGANSDLLYGANSDALWGTNSVDCIVAPRIEGLTIKGNRANNTSGTGIAIYAERPIIHDVIITDMPGTGMRTEWSNSASESLQGLEGRFSKIQIYRNGEHGWRFAGPHDSHVEDVVIFSSSLNADRTFQNLWIEKGNARWSKVHSYSTADILPKRVQHSLLISAAGSGNEFTMCHLEGGATNVRILGNNNIFDDTCRVYYPWDGINIALAGNGNIINCYCGEEYRGIGLPAASGVVFSGDVGGSSGNYVDIIASGCGGGSIHFGGSAGANVVRARGYNPIGTDVGYVGVPAVSDEVDIRMIGGLRPLLRQKFGYYNTQVLAMAAIGDTQSNAAQIPDNVQIINLNAATGGAGVRLPNATEVRNGAEITIFNTTAATIKVYPSSGGNIAGLGVNNPATISGLKTARLIVIDEASGQWGVALT